MTGETMAGRIYQACLETIQKMGVEEFKKASWFGWKRSKKLSETVELKKAA